MRTEVVTRRSVGPYVMLAMAAPGVAGVTIPGQFVSLAVEAPGTLLRRPFSVAGTEGGIVEVAFSPGGSGTRWLAERSPGDRVDLLGPLGHGFTVAGGHHVLAGGGYGSAPLRFLARALRDAGATTHAVVGAATADRLLDVDGLGADCDAVTVVTEDGSAGVRGRVPDALPDLRGARVAACGPMPMLAAVARAAAGVPCEVAVEEAMACGVGVCWTCVVPVRHGGALAYVRSCLEGPVLDGATVLWDDAAGRTPELQP